MSTLPRNSLLPLLTLVLLCSPALADQASDILNASGIQGGLIVHAGCGNGVLTAQLCAGPQYRVHGLSTKQADIDTSREHIRQRGNYGPVCVDLWDGAHLPYADNLVNLLVVSGGCQAADEETRRVLAPGGVLVKLSVDTQDLKPEILFRKPWPEEMDEWTHYFHAADGNPVAQDEMVGPPNQLRWIGSPRWSRHHDHMASMTSLVSAGGRMFYILDEGPRASIQLPSSWRLIARDAFNGSILWKRDIDQWNTRQYPLKSGPAHLLRRLVAIDNRVYVTLGIDAPTTVLDAATGETLITYQGSEFTREILASDGVVFLVADTSQSALPNWRRVSTYVWDNTQTANPDWGWHGNPRKILAYQADSGQLLWQADAPVAPCSLAVNGSRVVFHDGGKLVCLDRTNGVRLWEGESAPTQIPVQTNTGPRVLIYEDVVLLAANNGRISSWSAEDGRKLWEQEQKPSGHQSLKDLMVVDGMVWTGSIASNSNDGVFTGYDPRTGEVKREFPPDVQVHWFHHRCYPAKATENYLLTSRNGTEFIDLETEHWEPHHWVRGGCIYGVMPCNGMTYAPMDACGCQLEAKLTGFKALASAPLPRPGQDGLPVTPRLQKGPAYGKASVRSSSSSLSPSSLPLSPSSSASSDWPTYRHDVARSGSSPLAIPSQLGSLWQTKLGGRLSAPTIAAGKLFVADIDAHTVYALDTATGERVWSFTTGGRVDSPPTYYNGLALFGSADGYVYAVDAHDGTLAWRFRGAPVDRRMMAWEQLESTWPVHGSVLVQDGVVYCTAGRNMYLDGGIQFLRIDAISGQLLGEVTWDDKDPESGEDMHLAYLRKTQGNNMPVALSDILSCNGRNIWMRSQKIDFEGKRLEIDLQDVNDQPIDDCHLFCQIGFLDDSYFFRSYWTYGRRVTGGYGGWMKAGRVVPSGRILCFDEDQVFGFGRKPEYMVNSSVLEYQLFAADKEVTAEAINRLRQAEGKINARSAKKSANASDWRLRSFFPREDLSATSCRWTVDEPSVTARAMVLAANTVFVAGPPNFINEREIYRLPDAPDTQERLQLQQEALEGRHGGVLWALSKDDGEIQARYALDTIPVFDGMAAAGQCLYVSTVDGRVLCLSPSADQPLPTAADQPVRIDWDQAEDPNYLLPPEVTLEGDFDHVARCKILESDLGYRIHATVKGQLAIALQELDSPATGTVTLKTQMSIPTGGTGMNRNGFLAFGNGTSEPELIKCGLRLKAGRAMIIQGPLDGGQTKGVSVDVPPDGQVIEMTVTVDLANQQVTFAVGGETISAALEQTLKTISHVGYVLDNAVVDFAIIEMN